MDWNAYELLHRMYSTSTIIILLGEHLRDYNKMGRPLENMKKMHLLKIKIKNFLENHPIIFTSLSVFFLYFSFIILFSTNYFNLSSFNTTRKHNY